MSRVLDCCLGAIQGHLKWNTGEQWAHRFPVLWRKSSCRTSNNKPWPRTQKHCHSGYATLTIHSSLCYYICVGVSVRIAPLSISENKSVGAAWMWIGAQSVCSECITAHPGYAACCLNSWVLSSAVISLKTTSKKFICDKFFNIVKTNRIESLTYLRQCFVGEMK